MVVGRCPVLLQIKPHIIDHDFIGWKSSIKVF
jgi:hypothetical protein